LQSSGDREWGNRAFSKGVKPVFAADAEVAHPCRASFDELRTKQIRVHRGELDLRVQTGRKLWERRDFTRCTWHIRSVPKTITQVQPRTLRSMVLYVFAGVYMSAMWTVERARLARALRRERSGSKPLEPSGQLDLTS
jgi:GT2 family glycosyltransferase